MRISNSQIGLRVYAESSRNFVFHNIYSQTSLDRTSLGLRKFIREMGSSSQWDLIMAPGQEANGDNLYKSFRASTK